MKALLSKRYKFVAKNLGLLTQKQMAEELETDITTINILAREIKLANGEHVKKYQGGRHRKPEPQPELIPVKQQRPPATYSNPSIYDLYSKY